MFLIEINDELRNGMHDAENVLSIIRFHHKPANVAAQCADTHKNKIIRGSPPQLKVVPVIGTTSVLYLLK